MNDTRIFAYTVSSNFRFFAYIDWGEPGFLNLWRKNRFLIFFIYVFLHPFHSSWKPDWLISRHAPKCFSCLGVFAICIFVPVSVQLELHLSLGFLAEHIMLTGVLANREGEDLLWLPVQYKACEINNSTFSGRDSSSWLSFPLKWFMFCYQN